MRQKAERKIREAAARLGPADFYRLDQVRRGAGLHPKVFDKTILDMARLGTIRLKEGESAERSAANIGDLVCRGDTVYMYFSFAEAASAVAALDKTESPPAERIDIVLPDVDAALWRQFEARCRETENKTPLQILLEMIAGYCRDGARWRAF